MAKIINSLGSLNMSLKLITPVEKIEKDILLAVTRHLNSRLVNLSKLVGQQAQILIAKELEASPTTASLIGGQLRAEFGVVDADSELKQIYKAIASSVKVTLTHARRQGTGVVMKLRLTAVPFDLDTIIGGLGSYTTKKGVEIPWFEWLTRLGYRVIVRDYGLEGGHPNSSRTGDTIMVKGKKGWRVPPEFAGTPRDNFVTQATDLILPQLSVYIEKTVKGLL